MEIEQKEDNIADDIMKAMNEIDGVEELNDPADESKPNQEKPKELAASAEPKPGEEPAEGEKPKEPAAPAVEAVPQSWPKNMADKWKNLDAETRAFISKREEEVHRMATNQDQDRLFGRDMQQVLTPYIPAIKEAGGTPVGVIQNALNSMYWLFKGDEKQKQDVVRDIIQTYNINMEGLLEGIEYTDPTIANLQKEIRELKQAGGTQNIDALLTEKMNNVRIDAEIEAFASDPANQYFEQVRPAMVALLNSGIAKNLKEAYDAACRADPAIHSTLQAEETAKKEAQRKQDIAAKKRAASSVVGSPANSNPQPKPNPNADVYDDVRAAIDSLETQL